MRAVTSKWSAGVNANKLLLRDQELLRASHGAEYINGLLTSERWMSRNRFSWLVKPSIKKYGPRLRRSFYGLDVINQFELSIVEKKNGCTDSGGSNRFHFDCVLKEKKIVRLAKIDNKLRRMDSDYQFVSNNVSGIRTIEETRERIVFAWKILAPLLGPRLVSSCHVYHIDLDEIEEIERALEAVRPGKKKQTANETFMQSRSPIDPFGVTSPGQ